MIAGLVQISTISAQEKKSWQFWKNPNSKFDQKHIDVLLQEHEAKTDLERKAAKEKKEEYFQKTLEKDFFPKGRDKKDYWWLSDEQQELID